jgi:hypothetical protein
LLQAQSKSDRAQAPMMKTKMTSEFFALSPEQKSRRIGFQPDFDRCLSALFDTAAIF